MRIPSVRVWLLLLAVAAEACGGAVRYQIRGGPRDPGVDGSVVAESDNGAASTRVQVHLEHLTPPDRLLPGARAYVLWQRRSMTSLWQRVTALRWDEGARTADGQATVPETRFELQVTAELAPDATSPSAGVVMYQAIGAR